ncbi:hypothetical protein AHAS_Ahas06G0119900 [Arachis hypogaea]
MKEAFQNRRGRTLTRNKREEHTWIPPPTGWIKVNTNGAAVEDAQHSKLNCGNLSKDFELPEIWGLEK